MDCASKDNLEPEIVTDQNGENIKDKPTKEFQVLQQNSATTNVNGAQVKSRRMVHRQKAFYILLSFLLLLTIGLCVFLGLPIKTNHKDFSKDDTRQDDVRVPAKRQDQWNAKEKARIFFHSCLEFCPQGFQSITQNFPWFKNLTIPSNYFPETEEECRLTCKDEAALHLEYAVAALLLENSSKFSPHGGWTPILSAVREMAENIREELIKLLEKSQWHDAGSGSEIQIGSPSGLADLVEKARKIRIKIGFPKFIKDLHCLNEFYAPVGNMNRSDFMGNIHQVLRATFQKLISRIPDLEWFGESEPDLRGRLYSPKLGGTKILFVNGYTSLQSNEIIIPLSVLFYPLFDLNQTMAENYGALGVIIGHELFHGFTPAGLNFDEFGKPKNNGVRMSEDFINCLVKQYSNFKYDDGSNLNGTATLDENIADNGGLRIAMRAFLNLVDQQRPNFPGNDQDFHLHKFKELRSFFWSSARTWGRGEQETASTTGDPHSPNKFRVSGTLQNIREFSEVFSCPPQPSKLECPSP